MRRAIVIAAAGLSLAGCSSFSMGDYFKSTPADGAGAARIRRRQGADARTSVGPGCKTPCSVAVPVPDGGFSVTFSMNKFQPATVPVTGNKNPGDFTTPASTSIDPNPVVAELAASRPAAKPAKRVMRPKKPKPPKAAAARRRRRNSAFPRRPRARGRRRPASNCLHGTDCGACKVAIVCGLPDAYIVTRGRAEHDGSRSDKAN